MSEQDALEFLRKADVFFDSEVDPEEPELAQMLNMNDTFGWAVAWGEYVPDDKLVEVARLYRAYGFCGLVYWVSEQNGTMRSEFEDINRFIDFARNEERIRVECPDWNKRACYKSSYSIPVTR